MESLGELNTGDGKTLTNFINWSVKNAQADNYSLILSNHGGGITGSAWDDTDGHNNLKIEELTNSIKGSLAYTEADNGTKAFEMIGFNTCLQGVIDQQYSLKDVTNTVLASEEVSWSDYFNFEDWFDGINTYMDQNNEVTGDDMANVFVDLMKDYYESGETSGRDMTYSSVDTSALENLVTKVNELNTSLSTISADEQNTIKNSISSVVTFGDKALIDIGAFAKLIDTMDIGGTDGVGVDANAQAVISAVQASVNSNFSNMQGSSGDKAMGISMYYNGGYEDREYMDSFELANKMNMHDFYEIA